MDALVVGVLEVVAIVGVFLGILYLIQRFHERADNGESARSQFRHVLTGNYLWALRILVALMVLLLIGYAVTRWMPLVWFTVACLGAVGVVSRVGHFAGKSK